MNNGCATRKSGERFGNTAHPQRILRNQFSWYSARPPEFAAMLFLFRRSLIAVLVLTSLRLTAHDDAARAPAPDQDLASADTLFRAGKFAEAETSYQAILQKDTKLVPAQVGLVRSMLKQQKVDE